MKKNLYVIAVIFLFIFPARVFSQGRDEPVQEEANGPAAEEKLTQESIKGAFEGAIKALDSEKEKEKQQLTGELRQKLDSAVQEWISSAAKSKDAEVNKGIELRRPIPREDDNLTMFIAPDYYLEDYSYTVDDLDIAETDSLMAPYKAYVTLTEKLYIEKYHPSHVSSREPYLYTLTRIVKLTLEYRQDNFNLINTDYAEASSVKGWQKN